MAEAAVAVMVVVVVIVVVVVLIVKVRIEPRSAALEADTRARGPYAPQGSTPLLPKLSVTSKVGTPTSHAWAGSLVHFRSSEDVTLLEFTSPIDRE